MMAEKAFPDGGIIWCDPAVELLEKPGLGFS
jgi:hypothetical protein